MKWIGRILYAIFIFILGTYVLSYSYQVKNYNFFKEQAVPSLNNNDVNKYMQVYMTIGNVDSYLVKPIYQAVSNDDVNTFTLQIYQAKFKDDYYLLLFIKDFSFNEKNVENFENFKSNNDLARLQLKITFDNDEKNSTLVTYNVGETNTPNAFAIQKTIEEKAQFQFQKINSAGSAYEAATATKISKIELLIEDHTKENKLNEEALENRKLIVSITDDADLLSNEELVLNEKDVLVSNKFSGKITAFDFSEDYNDTTKLGKLLPEQMKEYNGVITKNIIIYILIVIVITFLLFFLKPILLMRRSKINSSREVIQTNPEEVIFVDEEKNE